MKRTILFLVCLMGMTFAFAQGNMQDVVYLKNGSIIRGEIIEMVSGETVKIMTVDGSVFVWDMEETVLFPRCGADTILGNAAGIPFYKELIEKLHHHYSK